MLHLSPHNDSILKFYQFHDGALQARFVSQSRDYYLKLTWLHFAIRVIFGVVNISSYNEMFGMEMPPFFWAYVAQTCFSALCFMLTYIVPILRRHIMPLHCIFCCMLMVVNSYLVPQQTRSWTDWAYTSWLPEGSHLAIISTEGTEVVDTRLLAYITDINSKQAFAVAIVEATPTWMVLALSGFNRWTLLVQIFVVVALTTGMVLTAHCDAFHVVELVFMSIAYVCISVIIERFRRSMFLSETLLARELHASQTADSILNHTLKNTLSDVAGIIEMFLVGIQDRSGLEDAITCLQRGMKRCKERQAYLKLVAGDYVPVLNEVRLRDFGETLISGRPVEGNFVDIAVYLDCVLCNLVLDNALSNALKHGDPDNPDVTLVAQASPSPSPAARQRARVQFVVSNAANPRRPPLTADRVQKLMMGHPDIAPKQVAAALSDRIGLSHCRLAAQQGGFSVALWQEGTRVYFRMEVDVELAPDEVEVAANQDPMQIFPAGLKYCVIDDSSTAQRLLAYYLTQYCEPSAVHCFGAEEGDVLQFLHTALHSSDVVIMDQHLEYSRTYLGTDLAQELQSRGYPGLICIRSGDDSAEDRAKYAECGAHCSFGKDLLGGQLVEELKRAYLRLRSGGGPTPAPNSPLWAVAYDSFRRTGTPPPDRSSSPTQSSTFLCVLSTSQTDLFQQVDLTCVDDEADAAPRPRGLAPPFLREPRPRVTGVTGA